MYLFSWHLNFSLLSWRGHSVLYLEWTLTTIVCLKSPCLRHYGSSDVWNVAAWGHSHLILALVKGLLRLSWQLRATTSTRHEWMRMLIKRQQSNHWTRHWAANELNSFVFFFLLWLMFSDIVNMSSACFLSGRHGGDSQESGARLPLQHHRLWLHVQSTVHHEPELRGGKAV